MKKIILIGVSILVIIAILIGIEMFLKVQKTDKLMETSVEENVGINQNEITDTSSIESVISEEPKLIVEEKEEVKPTEETKPIVKEEVKPIEPVKPIEEVKPTESEVPVVSEVVEIDTGDDFTLTDLSGNQVKLSDYRGKKVFVNFWATWCGPCVMEMPHIQSIFAQYPEIQILTINSSDDKASINSFMSENNYLFKVLIDADGSVSDRYNVNAIPTSILYDEKGKVLDKVVGSMNETMMMKFLKLN